MWGCYYVFCYEMDVISLFSKWLVFGCEEKLVRLFWLDKRRVVRDFKCVVVMIL